MAQLSAAEIKPHLVIEDGFADDAAEDALIDSYIAAAESHIKRHCRVDFDTVYPDGWPADLVQVIRVLVADWHGTRETQIIGASAAPMSLTVKDMLAPFRDLGA